MTQQCKGCEHSNTCETVYQRVGNSKAPSITGKVLIVFVLPILTFVIVLGLSEVILVDYIGSGVLKLISGLTALFAMVLVILASSFMMKSCNSRC